MSSCHGHVGKAGWVVVGKAGNRSAGRLLALGVPFFRDCAPTRGVSVQSPGSAVTFLAGFCCCCCCRCRSLLSSVLGGSEAAFAGLLEALLLLFRLRLQFLLLHFRDHSSDGAAAALAICSSSDVVRSPVVAFRFLPCPSTDGCPTPGVAPFPTVCGPIPAPVPAVTVCSAALSSCCSAAAPSVGAASPCRCCNARIRRCVFAGRCASPIASFLESSCTQCSSHPPRRARSRRGWSRGWALARAAPLLL